MFRTSNQTIRSCLATVSKRTDDIGRAFKKSASDMITTFDYNAAVVVSAAKNSPAVLLLEEQRKV